MLGVQYHRHANGRDPSVLLISMCLLKELELQVKKIFFIRKRLKLLVKLLDDVKNKSKPFMTPASLVFLHLS
jgi:hypothetical protein